MGRGGGLRAGWRAAVFVLELMPMLPSRPLEWFTPEPVQEQVVLSTPQGEAVAHVFRPASGGPHPGVVLCLGVVPDGLEHPQIPRLGAALARSGFVALIYWSAAMRDCRLDPADGDNLASAFQFLLRTRSVDPARSGLIGTCVGASFALIAAGHPTIRDQVAFVGAFAPYSSLETLTQAIASRTRFYERSSQHWVVDPLTWTVYVRTLTATLAPGEAERLRAEFPTPESGREGILDQSGLSAEAQAVHRLLTPLVFEQTEAALAGLPDIRQRLQRMSPLTYLDGLHAPLVVIGHDRDDLVIPIGESRRLRDALAGRAGLRYTEFAMFQHADPTQRKLAPHRLLAELGKFARYVYPLFRV